MANGSGIVRPFGNLPELLNRLVIQKLSPRTQILEQQLRTQQDNLFRSNLLTNFLASTDLSQLKASDILGFVGTFMNDPNVVAKSAEARFKEGLFAEKKERLINLGKLLEPATATTSPGGQEISTGEVSTALAGGLARGEIGLEEVQQGRLLAVDLENRKRDIPTNRRLIAVDKLVDNIRARLSPLEKRVQQINKNEDETREEFSDLSPRELEAEIAKKTGMLKPQRNRLRSQVQRLQGQERKALDEQIKISRAIGVDIGGTEGEQNLKFAQIRTQFQQKKITGKQFAGRVKSLMTPIDYKNFLISLVSTGELNADAAEKLLPNAGGIN